MTGAVRPMPSWFVALLIGEVVLAFAGSVLLGFAFLAFSAQPTARDLAVVVLFAAVPLLIVAAAAGLARHLWRTSSKEGAIAVALLPFVLGVPFLAMLFGVGF